MTTSSGANLRDRDVPEAPTWREVFTLAALGVLIVISSVGLTQHVKNADSISDYFGTVSEIIATLFIAVFVEAISDSRRLWSRRINRHTVMALFGVSLFGLFAAVRGLLGESGPVLVGIAACGLFASSSLVGFLLVHRVPTLPIRPETVMLIFLAPPTLIFAWF